MDFFFFFVCLSNFYIIRSLESDSFASFAICVKVLRTMRNSGFWRAISKSWKSWSQTFIGLSSIIITTIELFYWTNKTKNDNIIILYSFFLFHLFRLKPWPCHQNFRKFTNTIYNGRYYLIRYVAPVLFTS